MYHRSYEQREPIEVRIGQDELIVISYPRPDRSIKLEDLQAGRAISRRYRNRRIGEFLKELDLTEGRATGVTKIIKVMTANDSPAPVFESDDERSSLVVRLPGHPQATGEVTGEVERLMLALRGEMSRQQIQTALALIHEDHFRSNYLTPSLTEGLIEMTKPQKPRSGKQRYRLTETGKRWLWMRARNE